MSYDDKDRREIASRLRSKKPEEFGPRYERDVLEHIFHSLFPKQVYPVSNWVLRIPYTLADLIDCPTCRNLAVKPADEFLCSECGEHVDIAYVNNCNDYHAKYCPNCGAEVVDDD